MEEKTSEKISLKGMVSIAFLKKERFTGSKKPMRYFLQKEEEQLKATVYPGPYCIEATPEEQMESAYFAFSKEGLEEAVDWLNRMYEEKYAC